MPAVLDLPTEILCSIFELNIDKWHARIVPNILQSETVAISNSETILPPDAHNGYCSLPSLKELTRHCIVLSHICSRWRDVATNLQTLWSCIFLGRHAFALETITANILARSGSLPLYIDISIDEPFMTFGLYENPPQTETIIQGALRAHVYRCYALRIEGSDLLISAILDAFLDYNLLDTPHRAAPLAHLHVIQNSTALYKRTFPADLSLISPNLISLRAHSTLISSFPRRALRTVVLADTMLTYHGHFQLTAVAPVSTLALQRITIPGGQPLVRRAAESTTRGTAPLTRLALAGLQCLPSSSAPPAELLAMFFALTLAAAALEELELVALDAPAWAGLLAVLRPAPPLVFPALRRLTLRSVALPGARPGRTAARVLAASFPNISVLRLDAVEGHALLVHGVWRTGLLGLWAHLEEVVVDGTPVQREV